MEEKIIHAALLGLGTVGTGVYKVLKNQEEEMTAKIGCKVKISKILVRNLEKAAFKVGVSVDKDGVRFFMFGYFYI